MMLVRLAIFIAALGIAVMALIAAPLLAHSSPNSELRVHAYGDHLAIDLVVPMSDYIAATGGPLPTTPKALQQAKAAVERNLAVQSADGRGWQVEVETLRLADGKGPPDLAATIRAVPPAGAGLRYFQLDWRLFAPDNPGALMMVVLARDPAGRVGTSGTILGAMSPRKPALRVDLGKGSAGTIAINAFLIGAHHILEGYDHLLFLIALMLPAPLLARQGRWQQPRSPGGSARRIVLTVTAFTLGHSITLVAGAIWPIPLPAVLVESLIAASVLVSALHAIRPIFAANEPVIGGVFGLVHGLAFATLLGESAMGSVIGAASLLGFTLGIEAVQLVLVACAMPALVLLAPTRAYAPVRVGLGAAILLAALLWLANRVAGIGDALVAAIEAALAQALAPVAALLLLGAGAVLLRRILRPGPIAFPSPSHKG